jgi:hypothetical protein
MVTGDPCPSKHGIEIPRVGWLIDGPVNQELMECFSTCETESTTTACQVVAQGMTEAESEEHVDTLFAQGIDSNAPKHKSQQKWCEDMGG